MTQYAFGAGNFYATPLQDAWGNALTNQTPVPLMTLQEGSVDLSGEVKELYGQNQFPVAVGRGKVKMAIKVKPARIFAAAWNALFFGQNLVQGIFSNYSDSIGSVIPPAAAGGVTAIPTVAAGGTAYVTGDIIQVNTGTSTVKATGVVTAAAGVVTAVQVLTSGSYTVAPTASGATTALTGSGTGCTVTCSCTASAIVAYPQSLGAGAIGATFVADLGVYNLATGMPLKRVAAAPATGQYMVNTGTGVYTFASADAGLTALVSYQYTQPSTTGWKQTVQNLPMGYAPTFKADLTVAYLGKMTTFSFPMAVPSKFQIGFKNEDFSVPSFDFSAFDPGTGQVMSWSLSE